MDWVKYSSSSARLAIASSLLCPIGFSTAVLAQQIRIDPGFKPGSRYVFDLSESTDSKGKIKADGQTEKFDSKVEAVTTISIGAVGDEKKNTTVSASIERMRGRVPDFLGEGKEMKYIAFDTADVDDEGFPG